jgi:DNA polymerase-3 subunit epsilon
MNFVAIDVETANADMASICQIGLVRYEHGVLAEEWKSYIDPEDYFDDINVYIHGIDESVVKGAPTFPALADKLYSFLDTRVIVCHTHFDRVAMHQAAERYAIRPPDSIWLDSARVARRAWNEFAWRGYGLHNVCRFLDYHFQPHDALEDAKAAAHVLISAIKETGLDVNGWLKRVGKPIFTSGREQTRKTKEILRREGNREGALYGEVLVFTGSLSIPRPEATDLAAAIGCQVASGVTKDTTILVVGDQDIRKLAGHRKSSKQRKAEQLSLQGQSIRFMKESDFKKMVMLAE